MKRFVLVSLLLVLISPLVAMAGGLDAFMTRVNVEARADLPGFSAKISTQFGVPVPKVEAILRTVPNPADAFMVFQLGQYAQTSPERVMQVYNTTSKKGWGAMAQELGIKPGSAEFKALKDGNLSFTGKPSGHAETSGKGQSKSKGKGHN